jgi:hypothetical protein
MGVILAIEWWILVVLYQWTQLAVSASTSAGPLGHRTRSWSMSSVHTSVAGRRRAGSATPLMLRPVAELGEFAVDAPVTPRRVLVVEAQDKPTDLGSRRRSPGAPGRRLGPVPGDETAAPAEHGRRLDDQEHFG